MSGRIDWISKLLASAVFVFKHLAAHDSNINHVHPDHPYAHFFPYHRFPHEYHGRRQHRSGIGLEESSIHPPGRVALTRRWKKAYIGHTLWQIDHKPYARLLYRHFPRCSYPAVTRWMSSILPDVSERAKKISTETRSEFPLFCLDLPVFPWQRPLGEFRITIIMSPFPLVVPVIFGFDYPGRFHPRDLRCPSAVKSFCNFLEAQVLPIWSRSIYKSLGSQDRPIENVKCLNYDSNKQSSFSFSF